MSVVGPRAVWTDEEIHLQEEAVSWRKRWFIKPGLTGLAQINNATSADVEAKLRYDLEYIRRQSFWFDLKIVVRQLWQVATDAVVFLLADRETDSRPTDGSVGARTRTNEGEKANPDERGDEQKDKSQDGVTRSRQ